MPAVTREPSERQPPVQRASRPGHRRPVLPVSRRERLRAVPPEESLREHQPERQPVRPGRPYWSTSRIPERRGFRPEPRAGRPAAGFQRGSRRQTGPVQGLQKVESAS
jgi:hypothetical protein